MRNVFLAPTSFRGFDKLFADFDSTLNNKWLANAYYDEVSDGFSISSEMKFDTEKSQWLLTAEMAGVAKESLKLDVKEDHLYLSGEKTKGINKGTFERKYKLPEGCDVEKIEAEFSDGVLVLTLPLQEKKTVKSIQFK